MPKSNAPLVIRRSQLKTFVGISPSSVDRMEASGDFPRRKKFGPGIVGWYAPEVEKWAENRARNQK